MKDAEMLVDQNNKSVQVFTPRVGATLVSPYIPIESEIVALGANCTITLDGKAVPYLAGAFVGLSKGITYTLSASTDVHKM